MLLDELPLLNAVLYKSTWEIRCEILFFAPVEVLEKQKFNQTGCILIYAGSP